MEVAEARAAEQTAVVEAETAQEYEEASGRVVRTEARTAATA